MPGISVSRRLRAALALGLGLALAPVLAPSARAVEASAPAQCRLIDTTVPGAVTDKQAVPAAGTAHTDWNIRGELCTPAEGPAPRTVLLALHGITYTHLYWNSGYEPERYSFARAMAAAGYATFAIDRLGYGDSSRPPSALVSLDSGAEVAHQLIGQLREGRIGDTKFKRVVLVGHSYGTATSWRESAQYNDADAIIGTGWGSTIQSVPLARFFTSFYPAAFDPKFAAKALDPGYVTPLPGTRGTDFLYDLSNVDPKVVAYDEEVMRDTVTGAEGFTFYNRYAAIPLGPVPVGPTAEYTELPLSDQTKSITIPTFLVNGSSELFFCGPHQAHCASSQALQLAESKHFTPQACLRAAAVPQAGHDLNFQRNAQFTYRTIRTWLDQAVGPDGSKLEGYRKSCESFSGSNVASGASFGAVGG